MSFKSSMNLTNGDKQFILKFKRYDDGRPVPTSRMNEVYKNVRECMETGELIALPDFVDLIELGSSSQSDQNKLTSKEYLNASRVLQSSEKENADHRSDYYISVDVSYDNNSKSTLDVMVIKNRGEEKHIVNIDTYEGLTFSEQSRLVKAYRDKYKSKMIIADKHGLSIGLLDALEEYKQGEEHLYVLNYDGGNKICSSDSIGAIYAVSLIGDNSDVFWRIISDFQEGNIKLLKQRKLNEHNIYNDIEEYIDEIKPIIKTDELVNEIDNMAIESTMGKIKLKQINKNISKNKFCCLYNFYIYMNSIKSKK